MPESTKIKQAHSKKLHLIGWLFQIFICFALLFFIVITLESFPIARQELTWLFVGYALLLLRFPWLWMIVIPVCIPVLDLNLWSGRIYLTEFDLLVMLSAAIGLLRRDAWLIALDWKKRYWFLLFLLVVWQAWTTWIGLTPIQSVDSNSFVSYYSQYNSLRLLKGFGWALLLLPLLGQSLARSEQTGKIFVIGMILCCLSGIAALFWERALFTGLMNFSKEYRATGLFSITATGGAAVDAHLLMTLPFIYLLFIMWRNIGLQVLGLILSCIGLYACAITFSRANYPALLVGIVIFLGGWLYQNYFRNSAGGGFTFRKRYWALLLVIPLVGFYFLSNPYIASRFATTWDDLNVRFDHWSGILRIMEGRQQAAWTGMGKGSFPREYYFSLPDDEAASTATHINENGESFIRFSKSDKKGSMYLRQRFSFQGDGTYRLKLALRPTQNEKTRILVEFCERLVFEEFSECRWKGFDSKANANQWEEFNRTINLAGFGEKHWYGSRPVEIAILNRGIKQPLDVGKVELFAPSGEQLLHNPDFNNGWDRWTLYSGDHLAWHTKNIFVDAFFEGGWPGLLIFLILLTAIGISLFRSIQAGSIIALALAASFAGGLMVGLFDSLFDEPRITLFFYLLVWVTFSLQAPALYAVAAKQSNAALVTVWQTRIHALNYRLSTDLHKVLNSNYRYHFLVGLLLASTLLFYLFIGRHIENRHWMGVWNWAFSPTVSSPKFRIPNDTHDPGNIYLDGELQTSLARAFKKAADGSVITIEAGKYNESAVINADNVRILADEGAVIFGKATNGKGALIIKGDNTYIEGIECHSIAVSSNNGVCIRHEGNGLTLNRVHFHDAQGGLFGSRNGGDITIINSRFENLGSGAFSHGLYALKEVGVLKIVDSVFLNTANSGHEIKSRAKHSEITGSIIAATYSKDSRLVDVPNGGELILKNNLLIEGPNSQNADLLSWGTEGFTHPGSIVIENNLLISDKSLANLIAIDGEPNALSVKNNTVVGRILGIDEKQNIFFESRKEANLPEAPEIPEIKQITR